jgi:FAD dependent oxidoreductase TIGR03364
MSNKSAIVIGAGIVGLAMARSLSLKGYKVAVFERNSKATGASVRNFGIISPNVQPNGVLYERALLSRNIWLDICKNAGIWYKNSGLLQLSHNQLEFNVINEFYESNFYDREIELLGKTETLNRFNGIVSKHLKASLFSATEIVIDPREAIAKLPDFLNKKYNVDFHFDKCIHEIDGNKAKNGKKVWQADKIVVCSGQDFETLFPDVFDKSGITKCKLQMMRTVSQTDNWEIGATVAGGLTLNHYAAFQGCPSLPKLKKYIQQTMPEYTKNGIHVLVSQNGHYEFTIGDTHEYGLTPDPFDRKSLNDLVLKYLNTLVKIKNLQIAETWNGVYSRLSGKSEYVETVSPHTTIVNGLGGAGMTLAFGLADKITSKW